MGFYKGKIMSPHAHSPGSHSKCHCVYAISMPTHHHGRIKGFFFSVSFLSFFLFSFTLLLLFYFIFLVSWGIFHFPPIRRRSEAKDDRNDRLRIIGWKKKMHTRTFPSCCRCIFELNCKVICGVTSVLPL